MASKDFYIVLEIDHKDKDGLVSLFSTHNMKKINMQISSAYCIHRNNIEKIKCIEKRNEGCDMAILYKVGNRYMVTDIEGNIDIKTKDEVTSNIDRYMNVVLCNNTIKSIDGTIEQVYGSKRLLAKTIMYNKKAEFMQSYCISTTIEKSLSELVEIYGSTVESNFTVPNFIIIIGKLSLANNTYNTLDTGRNVISIQDNAASDVSANNIIIGDKTEEIGKYAFSYCNVKNKIVIGNGIRRIGYHAFFNTWADTLEIHGKHLNLRFYTNSLDNLTVRVLDISDTGIKEICHKELKGIFKHVDSTGIEIILPNHLQVLDAESLPSLSKMNKMIIPKSLKKVYGSELLTKVIKDAIRHHKYEIYFEDNGSIYHK